MGLSLLTIVAGVRTVGGVGVGFTLTRLVEMAHEICLCADGSRLKSSSANENSLEP